MWNNNQEIFQDLITSPHKNDYISQIKARHGVIVPHLDEILMYALTTGQNITSMPYQKIKRKHHHSYNTRSNSEQDKGPKSKYCKLCSDDS